MAPALAHDVAGSGEAVVLLHSGMCDRRMWDPQWGPLARRFTVVRCDLRGFGATALPDEPFSNADDVLSVLDHLGVERASLIGSSLGGRVALEVAAGRPHRVAKLALLCPALRGLPLTEAVRRFALREDELLERGQIAEATALNVRTWLGPQASEKTGALVHAMQARAFELQLAADTGGPVVPDEIDLARISAPALIVAGALDLDYFRSVARHLAASLPRARLVTLDWAAHLPSLERPEDVTSLMLAFLSERQASVG